MITHALAALLRRRCALAAAVALAAAPSTSCTSSTSPNPLAHSGQLQGDLLLAVGVETAHPVPGVVTLDGPTKLSVSADASGHWAASVPAGRYTVTARSPRFNGGAAPCRASAPVTVRENSISAVQVECVGK
jgi:hypothetical protein